MTPSSFKWVSTVKPKYKHFSRKVPTLILKEVLDSMRTILLIYTLCYTSFLKKILGDWLQFKRNIVYIYKNIYIYILRDIFSAWAKLYMSVIFNSFDTKNFQG